MGRVLCLPGTPRVGVWGTAPRGLFQSSKTPPLSNRTLFLLRIHEAHHCCQYASTRATAGVELSLKDLCCDTIPSGTEPLFLFLALGTPVWAPCKAGYHPLLAGIPTWAPIVRAHALPAWWAGPTWLLPIVGRDTTTICTACAAYTRREPSYNALGAFRCTKDEITPESVMHKDPAA